MAFSTDVFGRQPLQFGGAFAADSAICTFGGIAGGGVGLLTQQLNFQYQQQITRIYEVGTTNTYYVAGRSQGSSSVNRVLGPRPVSAAFYAAYGNICNAANNTLIFQVVAGCNAPGDVGNGFTFAMVGSVIVSLGMSVQAENMIVNESLNLMFIALLV